MELVTKRLRLRELNDSDKTTLPLLVNDLEVSQYLAVVPYPYTSTDAEWFVEHCKEGTQKTPRESYELGIELLETNQLIGMVGLSKVNRWDGKATLGYWLGKQHWRRGYMSEAVQAILKYAFTDLGLQRIDVCAAVQNEASNGLIRKLGSTFEGVAKRDHRTKSSKIFVDVNKYGLLKENWRME